MKHHNTFSFYKMHVCNCSMSRVPGVTLHFSCGGQMQTVVYLAIVASRLCYLGFYSMITPYQVILCSQWSSWHSMVIVQVPGCLLLDAHRLWEHYSYKSQLNYHFFKDLAKENYAICLLDLLDVVSYIWWHLGTSKGARYIWAHLITFGHIGAHWGYFGSHFELTGTSRHSFGMWRHLNINLCFW